MTNEKIIEEFDKKLENFMFNKAVIPNVSAPNGECFNTLKSFLLSALTQARLDTLEEVLRGMPEERLEGWIINACPVVDEKAIAFNACRDAVIKMIEGLRKEGV